MLSTGGLISLDTTYEVENSHFSHKNPSSKITRIRLDLSGYNFDITFNQGKMNTNADTQSRIDINLDILKYIKISSGSDKSVKKTLAITRGMSAKQRFGNITNKVHSKDVGSCKQMKSDQLIIPA